MSGWRIAYMIVGEGLKHEVLKVHDATVICAPEPRGFESTIACLGC